MRVTPKTSRATQITVRSRFFVWHTKLFGVTRVRMRNYRFKNVGWLDGLSDCLCWKISCHNVHISSLAHLGGWYPCDWPTSQCLYSFCHIQGVVRRKDNKGGSLVEACSFIQRITGDIPVQWSVS